MNSAFSLLMLYITVVGSGILAGLMVQHHDFVTAGFLAGVMISCAVVWSKILPQRIIK